MRFLYPELLWLLLMIPLLAFLKGRRGMAPALFFSTTSVARMLAEGKRIRTGRVLLVLQLLVIASIIIGSGKTTTGKYHL